MCYSGLNHLSSVGVVLFYQLCCKVNVIKDAELVFYGPSFPVGNRVARMSSVFRIVWFCLRLYYVLTRKIGFKAPFRLQFKTVDLQYASPGNVLRAFTTKELRSWLGSVSLRVWYPFRLKSVISAAE